MPYKLEPCPIDGRLHEGSCCKQCGEIHYCQCALEQWAREQPGANGVEPESKDLLRFLGYCEVEPK